MIQQATAREGLVQSAIGFSSRVGTQLCTIGVVLFAIRSLAISDFGAFAIASAFMFLFRRIFYVGPYEYMLQTPHRATLNGSCLAANSLFALGSTLLILVISLGSKWIFRSELVGELLRLMAPALFLTMLTSWFEALLLRRQQVTRYYIYTVSGEIVGAAIALWGLATGIGVYALVLQTYGRLAVLLFLQITSREQDIYTGYDLGYALKIIRWSGSRYATVIVNFFSVYGSDIMIGVLLTPTATGLFRAASRIVTALTDLFAQPLQKIAQTNLSARRAHGLPLDHSWLGMFSAVGAVGWATLAALACVAHDLVPAVLGAHWREAAPVVVVMCIVRGLPILDATTVSMLVCGQRRGFVFNTQIITAVGVVVSAAISARFGVLMVAMALGIVLSGQSIALCIACCRLSHVRAQEFLQSMGVALLPSASVIAAVSLYHLAGGQSGESLWVLARVLAVAAAGAGVGLAIIRSDLARSASLLAPLRPANI